MNDETKFRPSPVVVWNLATEMLEAQAQTPGFLDHPPGHIAAHVIAVAEAMQAQFAARYPDAVAQDHDAQEERPLDYPRSH